MWAQMASGAALNRPRIQQRLDNSCASSDQNSRYSGDGLDRPISEVFPDEPYFDHLDPADPFWRRRWILLRRPYNGRRNWRAAAHYPYRLAHFRQPAALSAG